MIKKDTIRLLEMAGQQSLDSPPEALAAVSLLVQAIDALMQDVFLTHLQHAGSPVTPDHIASLKLLQYRIAARDDFRLSPEDRDLLAHLYVNLVSAMTELPAASPVDSAKKVLIVDDEPNIREYLGRIMVRQGMHAQTAAGGMEAIDLFTRSRPDLVLLDVSLPDMDGIQILARLKEIDPRPPVFFVTGVGREVFQNEAVRLGLAGYLTKPVDLSLLMSIIKNL